MKIYLQNKKPLVGLIAMAVVVLALTACQPSSPEAIIPSTGEEVTYPVTPSTESESPVMSTATESAAMPESAGVTLNVASDPNLGKYLVDGKGMALYMFTKDEADKSNCSGDCLKAWPPLVSAMSAKAGEGIDASLIGSSALADGSMIVTYNKMPLYYWMKDVKPGDITGQGNNEVWFLVSPDGKVIGK